MVSSGKRLTNQLPGRSPASSPDRLALSPAVIRQKNCNRFRGCLGERPAVLFFLITVARFAIETSRSIPVLAKLKERIQQWKKWSGRPDLNRGPHAPQACALPGCATPRPPRPGISAAYILLNGITCLRAASRNCAAHHASPAATCDLGARRAILPWRVPNVRSPRARRPRHFQAAPAGGASPLRS